MANLTTFEELKLNRQLLDAIAREGFVAPTEIQSKCIPPILNGQEVIGIAQTGTGKTAAYLLPLLMKIKYAQGSAPRVLILAPTKELTLQIEQHAKALAINTDLRIGALFGGVGPTAQLEVIQKGLDLVVATPGRFLEFYRTRELNTKNLSVLVLDEADRMMDMGFMHQLRKILEVLPRKRQNLLFSATFSSKVEVLSEEFLTFPLKIEVTPQATPAKRVEKVLYEVPNFKTKINLLEHFLLDRERFSRVMIFSRTKEVADNLFKFIDRKGLGPVRVMHSNKGQNSRINAVKEFKEGTLRVLVSTDVSSRGLDVFEVSHVINFDVPHVYEDYVHRIGRTGRALHEGEAIMFCDPAEVYHVHKIEKLIREPIAVKPIPTGLVVEPTPFIESQEMAREMDRQRKIEDPDFKGAFQEKKRDKKEKFSGSEKSKRATGKKRGTYRKRER